MMKKIHTLIIAFLILSSFLKVHAQERKTDGLLVEQTLNDFFEWYIHSTRYEENEENRPIFIIDSNDVVCLDLTRYIANLRIHHFSEDLITTEIASYKNCEENLKKITKEEFLAFEDIFAYEDIDCGFDNNYKWIGGQEMIDGIRINKCVFSDQKNCHLEIEYYSLNGDEKYFWKNNTIIKLRKIKNTWKIVDMGV
ncbi:hypothetical protein [Marinifilum fragile]|uniref:hypothetical protein n=1 Tax=Marinifilum fragile TaxID=570161 RepID=UPI002AA7601E|nr:hypothetical protein [Marinifilum fragile]